jgi:hypothetical protein
MPKSLLIMLNHETYPVPNIQEPFSVILKIGGKFIGVFDNQSTDMVVCESLVSYPCDIAPKTTLLSYL